MLAQQPGGLTEVLKRGGTFFLFSKGGGAEMQLINPALSVRSVGLTLYWVYISFREAVKMQMLIPLVWMGL